MLTIRVTDGNGKSRLYQFREDEIHIGFRKGADIELEPVARHGAEIRVTEAGEKVWLVEPLKRAKGFFIGGQELKRSQACGPGATVEYEDYTIALEEAHPDSLGKESGDSMESKAASSDEDIVEIDKSANFLRLFLGPVAEYLDDEDCSEIMINGPDQVFVERKGKLVLTDAKFINEDALQAAVKNVARSVGRIFNELEPRLDARLPDGSRVHAVIPPMSRLGTSVAIRKFSKEKLTIEQLIGFGSLTEDAANLLDTCVKLHKNVMVSGATSSGKTSVLNVLSSFIQSHERIIIIEDSSELQLQQEHLVPYETRRPDEHGKGEVTIRDLIHSSLRLRPDRIIIGEIRGGEALDLLQALNTGHGGSMSTIHANSPTDSLSRLETCALLSGVDMPLSALRSQVASAIEVVVQAARLVDGTRKIISIAEVLPLEDGQYRTRELMKFYSQGLDEDGNLRGFHSGCGVEPTFAEEAVLGRLQYDPSWFHAPEKV
jgi:pilus assembly protein CpaF